MLTSKQYGRDRTFSSCEDINKDGYFDENNENLREGQPLTALITWRHDNIQISILRLKPVPSRFIIFPGLFTSFFVKKMLTWATNCKTQS